MERETKSKGKKPTKHVSKDGKTLMFIGKDGTGKNLWVPLKEAKPSDSSSKGITTTPPVTDNRSGDVVLDDLQKEVRSEDQNNTTKATLEKSQVYRSKRGNNIVSTPDFHFSDSKTHIENELKTEIKGILSLSEEQASDKLRNKTKAELHRIATILGLQLSKKLGKEEMIHAIIRLSNFDQQLDIIRNSISSRRY